ncbi:hypothetical protein PUN28_013920 [Cardiocondyla obscurior]|uniref:Uncharacterized protein n=1 Tax=Cardiocondyla obscurior TaxID=286306 RepID=A0AAW2F808_9HYME
MKIGKIHSPVIVDLKDAHRKWHKQIHVHDLKVGPPPDNELRDPVAGYIKQAAGTSASIPSDIPTMADQDILDIFGDSLSDLSDEEPRPQREAEPPDPRRGVPKVGSRVQRGDQTQVRHTRWLSEPPHAGRLRRRQVTEPTARRRTLDTLTAATEALDARAAGRPPPSPRAPPAPPSRPGWQPRPRPLLPPLRPPSLPPFRPSPPSFRPPPPPPFRPPAPPMQMF